MSPKTIRGGLLVRSGRPLNRNATMAASVVAEVGEPVLVHAEIVRQLMEDSDPDLLLELRRIGEVLLQRTPVDRDLRRHVLGPVEEAVEVGLLAVLVLDHDRHVVERGCEVGWEGVERGGDVLVEGRHAFARGTARCYPVRVATWPAFPTG